MARQYYQRAKARIKHHYSRAKAHSRGIKPVAIGVAAGAVAAMVQGYLVSNVDFFKSNWYGAPLAVAVAAFFVAKKNPGAGMAMAGAAGCLGYIGYVMANQNKGSAQPAQRSYQIQGSTEAYPELNADGSIAMDDGETSEVLEGY